MNKGCHTCMIKHTMHVQLLHCSTYLTWLDVCIYVPRSHFHFLKRMLGKGQLRLGRTHGTPYRGYGYVPLRFGGNAVRRMRTQQQKANLGRHNLNAVTQLLK